MENNMFYKYQEHRGQAGYKTAILCKEQGQIKYSLLVASETVPSVFGEQNSFEFDLLNSPVMGKIAGKISLDDKSVECLLHRDNIWRFEQLKGRVLDFLYLTPDLVGYKFSGTVSFRPNDATADVLRGTYTITPNTAEDTPIFDCRTIIEETLCFADVIPESIKSTDKVNLAVVQNDASVTYKWFTIDMNGKAGEETALSATKGIAEGIPVKTSGLVGIKAEASGFASWTTTIYVDKVA